MVPEGAQPGQQFHASVPLAASAPPPASVYPPPVELIVPAMQAAPMQQPVPLQPNVQLQQTTVNITTNAAGGPGGHNSNTINVELPKSQDLCVLMACCCNKCSIYTKCPECIGCVNVSLNDGSTGGTSICEILIHFWYGAGSAAVGVPVLQSGVYVPSTDGAHSAVLPDGRAVLL